MRDKEQYCCNNFYEATGACTDNERYGPAINTAYMLKGFQIGSVEDVICFCPWCGTKLN